MGVGLMSGDQPQPVMRIENRLYYSWKGISGFSSLHHSQSHHIHLGAQMKPQVTYWTACRPLVGGGRKEEDGKEGNPGRDASLLVMGGGECVPSFPPLCLTPLYLLQTQEPLLSSPQPIRASSGAITTY